MVLSCRLAAHLGLQHITRHANVRSCVTVGEQTAAAALVTTVATAVVTAAASPTTVRHVGDFLLHGGQHWSQSQ
jgi:hypothetical protein